MGELARGQGLGRHDLEVIIRRAAELEAQSGSDLPELAEEDVLRIAGEVGLSEASVRRALAEHYAGVGASGLLAERGWAVRLCGARLVSATRSIPRPAEEVRGELESHFQTSESLRLVRRLPSASLWEPDRGMVASLKRGLDLLGRGYELAKRGQAVELQVAPLDEKSCLVALTVDLGHQRAGWFWGLGVATGGAAAAAAGGLVLALSALPDLAALGAPALLGATIGLARTGYSRAVGKMRLTLEGLLDRLEHDEPLEPPRPSWTDLLK